MEQHKVIWLQPWCADCERRSYSPEDGRQWCQNDVWDACEECGAKSVKYAVAEGE